MNANQLFKWRREYERGALGTKVPALAAVKIVGVVIELEVGAEARLWVIDSADAATLATCLRILRVTPDRVGFIATGVFASLHHQPVVRCAAG